MVTNVIKKCFSDWKFSAVVLVISIILNIGLLCQPVFGTYTGLTEYRYAFSSSEFYQTTLSFNGGCATVNYADAYVTAYNAGVYQKIGDKIVIIIFDTNPDGGSGLDTRKRVFTRESVFVLSQEENQYTSLSAVFAQGVLAVIELVFVTRVILLQKAEMKKSEASEKNNSADV